MQTQITRRPPKTHVLRLIPSSVLFVLLHLSAWADQSATLTWNPSSDPDAAGYNIYYGTASRVYSWTIAAGTNTYATVPGLLSGTTYYFAVTTYDKFGNESDFSNEAVYLVPPITATLTAMILSSGQFGFTVAGVSGYQYVIQASTNLTDWTAVQTNTSPFVFTDTHATGFNQRFFRAIYQSP